MVFWKKNKLEQELLELSKKLSYRDLAKHFGATESAVRGKLKLLRKRIRVLEAREKLTPEEFLAKLYTRGSGSSLLSKKAIISSEESACEDEAVILRLSDMHIGKRIDASHISGLNEYNLEIFQKRLEVLQKKVVRICQIQNQAYNFTELVIFFLGDIIDGEQIYEGHRNYIDATVIDQFMIAKRSLRSLILSLRETKLFPKIRIIAVWGNHGRLGKKGEYEEHCNFDYLIYRMLEDSLQYSDIEFCISKSYFQCTEVERYRFLLMHGDNVRSSGGFPVSGMFKMDNAYSRLVGSYDYLELGHFHQPMQLPNNGTIINVNGSWTGGDIYSAKHLYVMSRPCQVMTGVHRRHGITWRYDIDIQEIIKR